MAPGPKRASPSSYDSGQEARKERSRISLFKHTNQTFISKPSDSAVTPAASIFGASTSSFTFTAGGVEGSSIKSSFAAPKSPSPAVPSSSFVSPQYPSDSGGSGSSDSGSRSQSMDSLTSGMATLKVRGDKPKENDHDEEAPSSSAASLSDRTKETSPDAEDDTSEESSESETSDESGPSGDEDPILNSHLGLLQRRPELDELNEIKSTPIFTEAVRRYAVSLASTANEKPFSQYGLLGGDLTGSANDGTSDPRIFWNIAAPSSFFICGSQGSGKSHTMSCLLENALAPCKANVLPRPLTGIVFHYDTFISDSGGSPCEVAWLSSNPDIKVRVLCPPTNIRTLQVCCPTYLAISKVLIRVQSASTRDSPTSALRNCA